MRRKNLKPIFSIAGATVILATFLAKDTRKDELKDLVASIDAEQNAYIMRTENRRNLNAIDNVQYELDALKRELGKPNVTSGERRTGHLGEDEIDWSAVVNLQNQKFEQAEILDSISRLAKTLPKSSQTQQAVVQLQKDSADFDSRQNALFDKFSAIQALEHEQRNGRIRATIEPFKKLIDDLTSIRRRTDDLDAAVLQESISERESSEKDYKKWTWVYYCLYLTGWTISVIGLLIGDDSEADAFEAA